MREVKSSDAKARLSELLGDVERGETIVIKRHGRAIARLVPEADQRRAEIVATLRRLDDFRKTMPAMSAEEILSARHEGHRR